jgi:pyrimidine deaminase RibD-like protein
MKISDFRIHDTEKLDRILVKLSQMIINGQKEDNKYYGMVAACVLDTNNEEVCAVNYYKAGHRVHAERAAIEKYHKQYGDIPRGSIIITTCSPCSEMMTERYGDSCTDLIEEVGVHKVYCGYEDPTQDSSNNYVHKTFHVKQTRNEKIRELCKAFADTFLKDDKEKEQEKIMEAVRKVNAEELTPKFVEWTKRILKLESDPEIEFSYDTEEAQEGHHTGRHTHGDNKIWIYAKNRNLVDIYRTLFHELVHVRQGELGKIKPGSSYPGSPIERQADEMAGKYIKIFGKEHPEIFQ